MVEVLAAVIVGLVVAIVGTLVILSFGLTRLLQHSQTVNDKRVNELLRLLEAKYAPQEFAAYVDVPSDPPTSGWLSSPDGLIVVPEDD